jgi:hypothetical protein
MALTLRQTIATGATNKGSELTYSELDANFVHLLESSNHNFTQSGTGAVSRTAEKKLQEWKSVFDFIPVAEHAAIIAGTSSTNVSTYAQAAHDAHDNIIYPTGTYRMENVELPGGSTVFFQGGVVFKFPTSPTANAAIFRVGDFDGAANVGPYRLIGIPTIDGTGLTEDSKLLRGFYLLGCKDVVMDGAYGISLPEGFPIHIAASTNATPVAPERITVHSVYANSSSYGAIGVTACTGLKIGIAEANGATSTGGNGAAVVLEPDVSTGQTVQDVRVDVAIGNNGSDAVHMAAHEGFILNVEIGVARVIDPDADTRCVTFSEGTAGTVKNVRILGGEQTGGDYGIHSPNNMEVENLFVANFSASTCANNGYRVTGGTWVNCSAVSCVTSGWQDAVTTTSTTKATYIKCKANNNNTGNTANTSGWRLDDTGGATFVDCEATNSGTQRYGIFASGSGQFQFVGKQNISGNVTGRYTFLTGARLEGDSDAYTVTLLDDFLGDVLADQWNGRVGSDPQVVTPTINSQAGGVVRLVTGDDAAASMAVNGVQLESALNWKAEQQSLVAEFRVTLSAITNVALFVGFTDQVAALEIPIESAASADTLTSNATNAVGVMFDTAMSTDNWWLVGVAADVDATAQNAATAPTALTFETWRIEVGADGTAEFFRNGVQVGTTMSAAVTATTLLTPVVAAFSRGAASRNIDVDFIKVQGTR